jgi:putative tricarboxylic transport membrane protein
VFTAAMTGLLALFTPQSILFMTVGVVYGLVIGILPGLGGIVAMALVLPFTFGFQPAAALALLLGAHAATVWGASITGILFNVPGAAKTITSVFDGYPMTQRGEGARALGASVTAALLGGVIGAIFLVVTIPIVRPLMLALGPSEYFMMAACRGGGPGDRVRRMASAAGHHAGDHGMEAMWATPTI